MAVSSESAAEHPSDEESSFELRRVLDDPRRAYRLFGSFHAAMAVLISLLGSLRADQPLLGAIFGLVLGGLSLAIFWKLGNVFSADGRREEASASTRPKYFTRETGVRALGSAPAGIWVIAVLLLFQLGISLGPLATVAFAILGCVAIWKAAMSIPHVERWVYPEA